MTKSALNISYDISTDVLGNGNNITPYISIALDEDGDTEITIRATQTRPDYEEGHALFVAITYEYCVFRVNENEVKAMVERDIAPLLEGFLDDYKEGLGENLFPAIAEVKHRIEELTSFDRFAENMDTSGLSDDIHNASDLDELCDALNEADAFAMETGEKSEDIYDSTDLPEFGGEEPSDTTGIYSWDDMRLLVNRDVSAASGEGKWVIVPRT